MNTITLSRTDAGWNATFTDPAVVEAFGTPTIPTAFTQRASFEKVRAELAALNPNCAVLPATKEDAATALGMMRGRGFIGKAQRDALITCMRGEERQFFFDMLVCLAKRIETMPHTYQQDGMGEEAIVYLHYFTGSGDWWVTEKDSEREQLQAFGLADLYGDGGELGYVSLVELTACNVELDLYWTPKTLRECRAKGAS